MVERRKPIKVIDALQRVLKYKKSGSVQFVSIEDSFGRFLGKDLIADHDIPYFDRSPYDGFAVRAEDTAGASRSNPVTFEVIGEIGAGSVFDKHVEEKQAVRIMTGAQLPEACDAVVMLEL